MSFFPKRNGYCTLYYDEFSLNLPIKKTQICNFHDTLAWFYWSLKADSDLEQNDPLKPKKKSGNKNLQNLGYKS